MTINEITPLTQSLDTIGELVGSAGMESAAGFDAWYAGVPIDTRARFVRALQTVHQRTSWLINVLEIKLPGT